jgi:hypothetical protein
MSLMYSDGDSVGYSGFYNNQEIWGFFMLVYSSERPPFFALGKNSATRLCIVPVNFKMFDSRRARSS